MLPPRLTAGKVLTEERIDEDSPDAQEGTLAASDLVRCEWTAVAAPVSEPDDIALRVCAARKADGHDEEADKGDDLDQAEPKLESGIVYVSHQGSKCQCDILRNSLSEELDAEEVDEKDGNDEDGEPDSDVHCPSARPVA